MKKKKKMSLYSCDFIHRFWNCKLKIQIILNRNKQYKILSCERHCILHACECDRCEFHEKKNNNNCKCNVFRHNFLIHNWMLEISVALQKWAIIYFNLLLPYLVSFAIDWKCICFICERMFYLCFFFPFLSVQSINLMYVTEFSLARERNAFKKREWKRVA